MAKLSSLIAGTARALQVPESRVRTVAANLRKHGLIASGPRGPGAYDMTPLDASALILGLMYDGDLADSHINVPRIWSAPFIGAEKRPFGKDSQRCDTPPLNSFFWEDNGRPLPFGMMFSAVIDWFVRYGHLDEDSDEQQDIGPVNLRFTLSTPGHKAEVTFNNMDEFWSVHYDWRSPEQIAYEEQHRGDKFAARWDARHGPHIWSSRMLEEYSLWRIADVLRGREYPDGAEEIEPPYQYRLREQDENRFIAPIAASPK